MFLILSESCGILIGIFPEEVSKFESFIGQRSSSKDYVSCLIKAHWPTVLNNTIALCWNYRDH